MKRDLSLLKYCKKCHATCCKTSEKVGSPILSDKELKNIPQKKQKFLRQIISPVDEKYWIIAEKGTNRCHFLNEREECNLEESKPLDCLCYPVKAIWKNEEIVFIKDNDCPAVGNLSKEFCQNAEKIALKSIKRFKKETYNHWLKNYVGWTHQY